jgi:hypothetical protein
MIIINPQIQCLEVYRGSMRPPLLGVVRHLCLGKGASSANINFVEFTTMIFSMS